MKNKSYSLIQLNQIKTDINSILEQKEEFVLKFVYGLVKNKTIVDDEIKTIREQLKTDDEKFLEYQREVFELYRKHGAEIKPTPEGGEFVSSFDTLDLSKFNVDKTKLDSEYEESIKNQIEINQYNVKISEDEVATPDWYLIPFNALPEMITGNLLTENILLFIEE